MVAVDVWQRPLYRQLTRRPSFGLLAVQLHWHVGPLQPRDRRSSPDTSGSSRGRIRPRLQMGLRGKQSDLAVLLGRRGHF